VASGFKPSARLDPAADQEAADCPVALQSAPVQGVEYVDQITAGSHADGECPTRVHHLAQRELVSAHGEHRHGIAAGVHRVQQGVPRVQVFDHSLRLRIPAAALNALCLQCSYNYCMTALTIRDVSDDAVRTMKIRAAQAGQSLQAYLRGLIEKEAARPTIAEAVERARRDATASISTADILSAIDEGRARH
jgi:antitoxin FitA